MEPRNMWFSKPGFFHESTFLSTKNLQVMLQILMTAQARKESAIKGFSYVFAPAVDTRNSLSHILMNCQHFAEWPHHFTFPAATKASSNFCTFSPALVTVCLFYYMVILSGCDMISHGGFDLPLPNDWWCWTSFYVLMDPMSIQIQCLYFKWLICIFIIELGRRERCGGIRVARWEWSAAWMSPWETGREHSMPHV